MSSAYGIKAIKPTDAEHVLGFASARGTADDALFEIWNGSASSGRVFRLDKAGQLQAQSGTVARPSYSFEADKDAGLYWVSSEIRTAIAGADVLAVAAAGVTVTGNLTVSGAINASTSGVVLDDNEEVIFGTGTDYWFVYSSSGTQFEFRATDIDGAGTDGIVWAVDDGTDDVVFTGNTTAVTVTGSTSVIAGTLTAAGGSITDSSGAITFGNENLVTTGTFGSGAATVAALIATTGVFSGILKTDNATDATSGTDGSLQTDGGLSVAKAIYVGTTAKIIGVTTHGGNVVSDTDSTDDLGTTGVRWANLWVDAITMGGTLAGAVATFSSTVGITGVTTHGGNVVSDTDSTDDLGTTGVRWANLYVDDVVATTTVKPGTLVLAAGSITDTSGAITFGNENLVTTGTLGAAATTISSTLAVTGEITASADITLVSNSGGDRINFGSNVGTFGGQMYRSATGSLLIGIPGATSSEVLSIITSAGANAFDVYGDLSAKFYGTLAVTGLTTATGGVLIAGGSFAAGRIYSDSTGSGLGLCVSAITDTVNDFTLLSAAGGVVMKVPTGTVNATFAGAVTASSTLAVTGAATFTSTAQINGADLFMGTTGDNRIRTKSTAAAVFVCGGTSVSSTTGSYIGVYGETHASNAGNLKLVAGDSGAVQVTGAATLSSTLAVTGDTSIANGSGLVVGHTALTAMAEVTPEVQVLGTAAADSRLAIGRWSANTSSATLAFVKSRNATIGSKTTIVSGDNLGQIVAYGDDGTDYDTSSSAIIFDTEGTIATGQVPGQIRLQTAAAGTLTTALTINSAQAATFAGTLAVTGGETTLSRASTSRILTVKNASAGSNSEIYLKDGSTDRYRIGTTGSGADFRVYDAVGSASVLTYDQSATKTTFAGSLAVTGTTTTVKLQNLGTTSFGSVLAATAYMIYASPTLGNVIAGYGTTNDITILNRAGATAIAVPANSVNVTMAGDLSLAATKKLYLDGGSDTYLHENSANVVRFVVGGSASMAFIAGGAYLPALDKLYFDGGGDTYIFEGAANDLRFVVGGTLLAQTSATEWIMSQDLSIPATKKFYLDGSGNTYLYESSGDNVAMVVGGSTSWVATATQFKPQGILAVSGTTYIGDTANANATLGLTINQGSADNEILALKSSDIAHGMTAITETDTYATFAKYSATLGGLRVRGLSEGTVGILTDAIQTSGVTTKTTGTNANYYLNASLKNGTGITDQATNTNLLAIANNATVRFIFDAEGSAHADVEWTTF